MVVINGKTINLGNNKENINSRNKNYKNRIKSAIPSSSIQIYKIKNGNENEIVNDDENGGQLIDSESDKSETIKSEFIINNYKKNYFDEDNEEYLKEMNALQDDLKNIKVIIFKFVKNVINEINNLYKKIDDIEKKYKYKKNEKKINNINNDIIIYYIYKILNINIIEEQFKKILQNYNCIINTNNINNYNNSCINNFINKADKNKNKDENIIIIKYEFIRNINELKEIKFFGKEFIEKNKKYQMKIMKDKQNINKIRTYNITSQSFFHGNNNRENTSNREVYDKASDNITEESESKHNWEEISNTINLIKKDKTNNIISIKLKGFNNNIDLSHMFYGCSNILSLEIDLNLHGINIINMTNMFKKCKELQKIIIVESKFKCSIIIKDMTGIFADCNSLKEIPNIFKWDTTNVETMKYMFSKCHSLKNISYLQNLNTLNVKDMSGLFEECISLESLSALSNWKTNSLENMNKLFFGCEKLNEISGISNWDISKVTNMSCMFYGCESLAEISVLSEWKDKTSKVKCMSYMFGKCSALTNIDLLSKWDLSNVVEMNNMFEECTNLEDISNLSLLNPLNVRDIGFMFYGCTSLVKTPKEFNFETNSIKDMSFMFYNCKSLEIKSIFNISKFKFADKTDIFTGCKSKCQCLII